MFSYAGASIDGETYKAALKALKKTHGPLAKVDSVLRQAIVARTVLSPDPEGFFRGFSSIFEGIFPGFHLEETYVTAALCVVDALMGEGGATEQRAAQLGQQLDDIFADLNGPEDVPFAALAIRAGADPVSLAQRAEEICGHLESRARFDIGRAQIAADMLALGTTLTRELVGRFLDLRETLDLPMAAAASDTVPPFCAVMADLGMEPDQLSDEIARAGDLLLSAGATSRLITQQENMLALQCMVVLRSHRDDIRPEVFFGVSNPGEGEWASIVSGIVFLTTYHVVGSAISHETGPMM